MDFNTKIINKIGFSVNREQTKRASGKFLDGFEKIWSENRENWFKSIFINRDQAKIYLNQIGNNWILEENDFVFAKNKGNLVNFHWF